MLSSYYKWQQWSSKGPTRTLHYYWHFFKEKLKRFRGNKYTWPIVGKSEGGTVKMQTQACFKKKKKNISTIMQWCMAMQGSYHSIEQVAAGKDTAHLKAHSRDKSKGKQMTRCWPCCSSNIYKITVAARSTQGYYSSISCSLDTRMSGSSPGRVNKLGVPTNSWSLPNSEFFSERLNKWVSHTISTLVATINTRYSYEPIIYILIRGSYPKEKKSKYSRFRKHLVLLLISSFGQGLVM